MHIDRLYLQVTRNCTLNCEHCLKGDKEHKNMFIDTLKNILLDIDSIDTLLLTGGEPLLNIDLIEELVKIINSKGIDVRTVGIVTNGTVLSDRHIDALTALKDSCQYFKFHMSSDLFHRMEWDRLDLTERIEDNYDKYNSTIGIDKFLDDDRFKSIVLFNKGRAKKLSTSRLDELKKKYYVYYKVKDEEATNELSYDGDNIFGKICIDVNGNLVDFSVSYEEEDMCSNEGFNINYNLLRDIIYDYIDSKNKNKKKILF